MATAEAVNPNYQIITNETGRVFRVGEEPKQILGYSRGVVIWAAWLCMCLAGLLLALWAGEAHQPALFATCAVISGGLSGANFPMTAAMVADYYGETNNAINYGSIYAWKALGGSFAGGGAAFVMTGTLYGTAHYAWPRGFFFGAALGFIAMLMVTFKCKRPSVKQMQEAVTRAEAAAKAKEAKKPKPAMV